MNKLIGWLAVGSLLMLLAQWQHGIKIRQSHVFFLNSFGTYISFNTLWSIRTMTITATANAEAAKHIDGPILNLFEHNFFSEHKSLKTWNHMKHLLHYSQGLPNALEAIKEASVAWDSLISSNDAVKNSSAHRIKNRRWLHLVSMTNATKRDIPTKTKKELDLFVGVFSTADNFERRMAVRRSWMQYPAVRSGTVAVGFFVGLHKMQQVNEALWSEANEHGDIQLMPWVDNYNLLTLKTVAICIFGSQVVSAKYIMKTDDDAFVRIDEVLASLNKANVTHGLLYGLIDAHSKPNNQTNSKWYISPEEWPNRDYYPPWAHGPGYAISRDIAMEVNRRHEQGTLKMFKLEDVAMGIWIEEMKKQGMEIHYISETTVRINTEGCQKDYVVAHYQSPSQLLCIWEKLDKYGVVECCN